MKEYAAGYPKGPKAELSATTAESTAASSSSGSGLTLNTPEANVGPQEREDLLQELDQKQQQLETEERTKMRELAKGIGNADEEDPNAPDVVAIDYSDDEAPAAATEQPMETDAGSGRRLSRVDKTERPVDCIYFGRWVTVDVQSPRWHAPRASSGDSDQELRRTSRSSSPTASATTKRPKGERMVA